MIVITNYVFSSEIRDCDELLVRYHAQTGWAKAVRDAGAAVTVVQRFAEDRSIRRDGVDYTFVSDSGGSSVPHWFWCRRTADVIRRLRPKVVHVNGLVFPLQIAHLRRRLAPDTALVVQDHGGIYDGHPCFSRLRWRALHRIGLRGADGFLFTCRELAEPWQRAGIVSDIQPIYAVVEASSNLHASTRSPPAPETLPGSPALLWVGRLDANKDPLTVLDGFELALRDVPNACLTMVFDGDDLLPAVSHRVRTSVALARRVRLRGRLDRDALPTLYRTADLFVLGSHHEGSGFALIEALGFGVTPVVTDIPAFRAITGAGRVGALFPVGDAKALGTGIARFADEHSREAQRAAVRQFFDETLSWRALGSQALAIYREAERRAGTSKAARSLLRNGYLRRNRRST